ncbi:MAG: long-chain fatty acid--CoA ligase [Deltaproteobacteria bacterium]|nr:long-chain fatty acid--CoA ligase [Deltaproteobacteria bacterium]PWB66706.1 MAG: 4-coumarate--CoA ligase family protein [Deltaproteobacteria bacterium]
MKSKRPPVSVPSESLTYPLRQAAASRPDKAAVITPETGGQEYTYRWLEEKSSCLAASLARLGLAPGGRVALWMKNSVEYILSFYGILKAGGVIVPVSTHYGEKEVLHQVSVTGAAAMISTEDRYAVAPGLLSGSAPSLKLLVTDGDDQAGGERVPFSSLVGGTSSLDRSIGLDPRETVAVLPFSSGTTGLPKGVMLTHANLLSNLYQVSQAHDVAHEDLFLNQLPFFHIYGMTVLMGASILAGATQVLASRFRPVDEFLSRFEAYRPTLFFTVPLILQEFCHHPSVPRMDWSRMRYVNTGGAPLSPELQERFTRMTGVPVMQGYGLTESSPTTHVNPLDRIRVGSIGTPLSLTEDRIADPETGRELPEETVGELWVRGPQVMKGYFGDPESTGRTLVDGWLRTGDLARRDGDGYIFIVDRLKELIKCKGFQVAPAEIEHILVGHPGIRDAAVIGQPHPEFGEVPVAFVVLKEGARLSPEEVIDYAAKGLAKYKRLARVLFTDGIPRGASGKILRRVLKEHPPG